MHKVAGTSRRLGRLWCRVAFNDRIEIVYPSVAGSLAPPDRARPSVAPTPAASKIGGGGGIRTHEGLSSLPVFKTGAFNRSATPPGLNFEALIAFSAAARPLGYHDAAWTPRSGKRLSAYTWEKLHEQDA
jgi:hypothetical protein